MPLECTFVGRQLHLTESNLPDWLRSRGLASPGDALAVEKAGEGNINWVRRVRRAGDGRRWIVKQARPALERFPQYSVTTERLVFEARYYEAVRPLDAEGVCPAVLDFDPDERVLVLEDLGDPPTLDAVLGRGEAPLAGLRRLARLLGRVHAATRGRTELLARFRNREMQTLHGDHVFALPLRPNDFPLEPELRARADALAADADLVALADAAYARYRGREDALVHGDVQSTNLLVPAPERVRLLDAEIAHAGDPAFDAGVLVAHLLLPGAGEAEDGPAARAGRRAVAAVWEAYAEAHGPEGRPAFGEIARYAGIELLRRTIGAARMPSDRPLPAALATLALAERLMRTPPEAPPAP